MKSGVLVAVAILFFAAFLNLRGIDREKYENDEALWILQGQKYWPLFSSGQWDRREWNDFDSSWGTPNPPVAKYLLGFALSAQNVHWKWDGNQPPKSVLAAARVPSAIAGVLGCAGILIIGFLSLSPRAALFSGLLLATSPVWMSASRHAMTDIYGVTLSIWSVVPFVLGLRELAGRSRVPVVLAWIALAGIFAGLAVGAKLNAASTPAALGLVIVILFLRELFFRRARREARLLFLSGIGFAAAACGTFIFMNPYLHPDPWGRFSEMIGWWTQMTERRVELTQKSKLNAFSPQKEGVRVFFGKLAMVPKSISFLLLLPLGAAFLARRRSLSISPSMKRLFAWMLLLAPAVVLGVWPNQILHPWLLWFGGLSAVLAWVLFARPSRQPDRFRLPVFAIVVWGIVAAFFVWRMTFIPWLRYYLPALPALSLLAGFGLAALREDLRNAGGAWPRLIDAAVICSALSVAFAFPDYGIARMQNMSKVGGTSHGILLALAIASMAAAIMASSVQVRRLGAGSKTAIPPPTRTP